VSLPRPPLRRLVLAQLPLPALQPGPMAGNIPLAAGSLAAALSLWPEAPEVVILPPELAERLGDTGLRDAILALRPDVVGFSLYVWNAARSLALARSLRAARPELRVVVGGPECQADNPWLAGAGGFDVAVRGEGERTLPELLHAWRTGRPLDQVPGLLLPGPQGLQATPGRAPLASDGPLPSPYLGGHLDPRGEGLMLVETSRGCRWGCAFCAYRQSRAELLLFEPARLEAELELAQRLGIPEVYLLDPSLDQRPDFDALLARLAALRPRRGFFAEVRAEAISPQRAAALARAGFFELEIGLQAVRPATQRLMGRRNDLGRFVAGTEALRRAGVRFRVDAIVGLPGDGVEGSRATFDFLEEHGLDDRPFVFPLAVLPGTRFRQRAVELGLRYQAHPPHQLVEHRDLSRADLAGLLAEAEDRFGMSLLPEPRPLLLPPPRAASGAAGPGLLLDLDREPESAPSLAGAEACFTLWLRCADPWAQRGRIVELAGRAAAATPQGSLHLVLEVPGPFPHDLFDALAQAWAPPEDHYLEAYHAALQPPAPLSRRCFVLLPVARRPLPAGWAEDLPPLAELVWRLLPDGIAALQQFVVEQDWPAGERLLLAPQGPCDAAALDELRWAWVARERDPERLLFADAALQWMWDRRCAH